MTAGDYVVGESVCEQLVCGEHEVGWQVCGQLGQAHQYGNLQARARFLDFALTFAPSSHLENLINARNQVEMAILYSTVNTQMDLNNSSMDSDDGFVDAPSHVSHQNTTEENDAEEDGGRDGEDDGGGDRGLLGGDRGLLGGDRGLLGGVTRSVLSVTTSTTATLINTVASKQFWKSAVNWMQPLSELSCESEKSQLFTDTNADLEKQGCHAFYADIIPDPHISSLGVSYLSYANATISNPALDFSMALLRIGLIQETLTQGASVKTTHTVVSEAARGVLREDMSLGLMILGLLQDPNHARGVLAPLPRTHLSLQMMQYFYALQIYTSLHPWTKPTLAPVYLSDPSDVIAHVGKIIDTQDLSEAPDDVKQYVELYRSTRELVADYAQGQALQRLGAGVDIDRFLSDAGYKEDTVLGLAMTLDPEVLDLALTLARKYEVSLWDVHMTHLQHLFDSEITTAEIQKHITEKKLVEMLTKKPKDFAKRMEQNVFLTIDGCDHDRLLLYYSLLEQCGGEQTKKSASHIKLLKKLKGSAEGLNYKLLLKPDSNVLSILQPVLTAENVNGLAKVAKNVPCRKGEGIEPSTVYCAWAQKFFFNIPSDKKLKTSDWVHRYESCGQYMQKMSAGDVERFLSHVVLSEAGQAVPIEARTEITNRAAKFCHQGKKKSGDDCGDGGDKWSEVGVVVERWAEHLNLLRSSTFNSLQASKDPRLRNYAKRFAGTGSSEELLRELSCAVLVDGCDLSTLGEVLAVYPDEAATTPEDVLMDTIRLLCEHWRGNKINILPESVDAISTLDHVLGEVHSYMEEGGEVLGEEEVLAEVRELCEDPDVPLLTRVQVLTIAQKHLTLSEDDVQLERVMRTGGIVHEAWTPKQDQEAEVQVDPNQLGSIEGRLMLLNSLIQHTSTLKQATALVKLLSLWPPFNKQDYEDPSSNPWQRVCTCTLDVTKDDPIPGLELIWKASTHAFSQHQLGKETIRSLVKQLQGVGRVGLRWSSKMALLLDDPDIHSALLDNLKDIEELRDNDYDGDLLDEVVRQNLVASILPSALYAPLVARIMESGDRNLLGKAVEQLEDAGKHQEAASLALTQSSIPKSLHNITAALKTYRKWL